jgi:flavin-dependent dehydrogenase
MLDVAIIGGGPAGVAAALSLRQLISTASIAIFDASRGDRWSPGEILPPGVMPILESLGCGSVLQKEFERGAALESFGIQASWGGPQLTTNEFLYSLHGKGWRLDRARFDATLRGCAETTGVQVKRDTILLESHGEKGGWKLWFRGSGCRDECRARFVIDASGRSSRFAIQRGSRPICSDRLAGSFMLFEANKNDDKDRSRDTLIEAAEHGWWYSAEVPNDKVVVGWISDTDLIRKMRLKSCESWNELLAQSKHTRQHLSGAVTKGTPMIFAAHSQILNTMSGRGWVAAGDAAMTFDPLSSQGITKALRSGKMASFVAADFLLRGAETHQRYEQLVRAEYAEYDKVKRGYYLEEQRWPSAEFWQRRHRETPVS